jgi:hypothetical protein
MRWTHASSLPSGATCGSSRSGLPSRTSRGISGGTWAKAGGAGIAEVKVRTATISENLLTEGNNGITCTKPWRRRRSRGDGAQYPERSVVADVGLIVV